MRDRTEEVFGIIAAEHGLSAAQIHAEMVRRSWLGRKLGERSFLAYVFSPSVRSLWLALQRLETGHRIYGLWVPGPYPRRRLYYAGSGRNPI